MKQGRAGPMPAWPSPTSASDASALAPSRWLLVVSFASGAAGLVYETVWFHRGALVFGNSIWSTSLVLSSFMAGLALGGAAGVLATEVWLIGMFGVAGSAWCAAILGVAAAAMALRLEAGLAARLPARAGRPTQASELAASRRSAVSPMPARASLLLVASFL